MGDVGVMVSIAPPAGGLVRETSREHFVMNLNKIMADCSESRQDHAKQAKGKTIGQCIVCFEDVFQHQRVDADWQCYCICCPDCTRKWIDHQLDRCVAEKTVRVSCVGCKKMLSQKVALALSPAAAALAEKIDRRERLQSNPLYPSVMQVECPMLDCVGIGYMGFETIMCFMCEHQWLATGEFSNPDALNVNCEGMKSCPKCQVMIEKNGGCDHMTCTRCAHQFWWSTLKDYK